MSAQIRIFDTTLRDGEQTPGVHLTLDHKTAVAARLEAFGVATIEAGFPISSPGDRQAVTQIAQTVQTCEVAALARCLPQDIDVAVESVAGAAAPVVHVFLGTSDIHLERKLRMNRAQAVRAIESSVARARQGVATVQFTPEDATRTERPFLRQCIATAVAAGARRINIADTVGCALPHEFGELVRDIVRFVGPSVIVSAHCHDDLGMATANTIAAVRSGARQVEVTVNGIGERAGNAAVEEVAVALTLKDIAATGLVLSQIAELSQYVSRVFGVPVQPNRAIAGAHAFAHSSGIHQDGILKDPACYGFVPPELVGVSGHQFVLTARSGRSAIAHAAGKLGYALTADQIDVAYQEFIRAADTAHGAVSEEELVTIVEQVRTGTQPREQYGNIFA